VSPWRASTQEHGEQRKDARKVRQPNFFSASRIRAANNGEPTVETIARAFAALRCGRVPAAAQYVVEGAMPGVNEPPFILSRKAVRSGIARKVRQPNFFS
jgi:hypothetical protein